MTWRDKAWRKQVWSSGMRPRIICCGELLTTVKAVIAHCGTVKIGSLAASYTKQSYKRCDAHKTYRSNCEFCVSAAWLNAIDRKLQKKGLILDTYIKSSPEDET